jgi:hypothetical protein
LTLLLLKILATPLVIGGATLAGRRWGGTVSGWIVGLPLTSGPVSLFVALQHGRAFAAHAAAGSLGGVIAEAAFFVAWGLLVRRGLVTCIVAGSLVFAAVAVGAHEAWPLVPLAAVSLAVVVATLRVLPTPVVPAAVRRPPGWDLPARAVVATVLVVALTEASGALGARLTGIAAVYPLYTIVMAAFAGGAAEGLVVLRGVLYGLFAFVAFFLTLGLLLHHVSIAPAYVSAAAAALVVQALSLLALP